MASENAKKDSNYKSTLTGVTDDATAEIRRLIVDATTGRLKVSAILTSGAGIASLGGLTTSTQLFAIGSAGNQFNMSSAGSTHTFNLPTASATGTGQLTGANWTTFNNKADYSFGANNFNGAGSITTTGKASFGTISVGTASTGTANSVALIVGNIDLSTGTGCSIFMPAVTVKAFTISQDQNDYLTFQTSSGTQRIIAGANFEIGTIQIPQDSGAVTLIDMPVSTAPGAGVEQSYDLQIDSYSVLKVYSVSTSGGTIGSQKIIVSGDGQFSGTVTAARINSLTLTKLNTGFSISGGTTLKTLDVDSNGSVSSFIVNTLAGSTGNQFNISSSGSTATFNLPTASATGTGQLTAADWSTFNSKAQTAGPTFSGLVTSGGSILAQQGVQFNTGAYFDAEYNAGNSGTSVTVDWTNGNKQLLTLTGSGTITMTAPTGICNLILRVIQNATGTATSTWSPLVKWSGGSVWSSTGTSTNIASFYWNGLNFYGMLSNDFV